jgi:hypothetical protein
MNFVVGVGLLEPQTANGSESFLTPSLSCCNPPASTPGPTQGTRFYCLRQGPCWAPIRQSKDPPTKDRRGGSLLRGSALNFPLALASGCQPDRVGLALLCCTSPQRCDERNPVGDNGQGFNDGGCFRCYVLMQEQNITPNIPGAVSLRRGDFEKEPKTHVRLGPTWEGGFMGRKILDEVLERGGVGSP